MCGGLTLCIVLIFQGRFKNATLNSKQKEVFLEELEKAAEAMYTIVLYHPQRPPAGDSMSL
jgi:hypothetical protein